MLKKVKTLFLVLVMMVAIIVPTLAIKAEENKELDIYAMYLGDTEKGDSTLLVSKGQYLLIDIGAASSAPAIISQLQELGITHVDVLFSHLHTDHIGAHVENITVGLEQFRLMGITVDKLYLPSTSLAPLSQRFVNRSYQLQNYMNQIGGQVVFLNVGDLVQVGDAVGKVIGPVDSWKLSPSQYLQYTNLDQRNLMYENNCSLAMIFTCGNTRYFTAGDCYADEAKALVDKYGTDLKCDIMKLCHHGIGAGNSNDLLSSISPLYSYIPNSGVESYNDQTGQWKTYTAIKRATKYGMCYMVGTEKKTLIYHIVNDTITLYQGKKISDKNKMIGWQYLYGADGINRDHDMYYLNSNCKPLKGVRKIGNHYFRFKSSGQMDYGKFSEKGNYLGWKSYGEEQRYFTFSKNQKYAYMNEGLNYVNGIPMYFDESGYLVTSETDDETVIKKLGSYYYAIDYDGEVTVDNWEDLDGFSYYFDSYGRMIRNRKYEIDGEYYLFDSDGTMYVGNAGTELYDFKSNTYAVRKDGTLVTGKCAEVDGDKYYFGYNGAVQKNKIIQIGKKQYYFGMSGKMARNRTFKWHGKKYHSDKNGVLKIVKTKVKK